MKNLSRSIAMPLLAIALFAFACGKPKQSEVPDADKETGGPDLAAEDPNAKPSEDKPQAATNEELRSQCCASCKEGLSKDRSGAGPEAIPCSDFTANLSFVCLEYFRANPTKASECK